MIKNLWENFLTSGLNKKENTFEYIDQIKSINIFSILGIIMLLVNSLINLSLNNVIDTYLEFSIIFILIFNILFLRKTKKYNFSGAIILFSSIILLSSLMITGGINKTGILWVFYFPLIAFFLKKKKQGTYWIITFLLISLVIVIIYQMGIINIPYSLSTIRQVFIIFITISILTFIFEFRREQNEQTIKTAASIDVLTGLPNRAVLLEDLSKAEYSQIILINIDDFKELNNFYGHLIGDEMLIALAEKLKYHLPENNFQMYKLHADEYAVLTKRNMTEDELRELAIYLNTSISYKFFKIKEHEITINVTIGIAEGKNNIIENADIALKHAKQKKKNYMLYDESLNIFAEYANNLIRIKQLKNGITENKIIPYFQPIIDSKTGEIVKYECLARLIGPNKEILTPDYFINLAKKAKLCTYITRMMLKKSIEVFSNNNLKFSINLTLEDILNKYTIAYIKKLIKDNNIGKRLIFEILESESIDNYQEVSLFIRQMKEFGCEIAIDDFGTGYSNFQHILKLKVDYLKIDASLIMNLHKDINSQIIVKSIVDFTKKLKIKTVAEFVYCQEVLDEAKLLKIDYLQGYHLGQPKALLV